MNFTEKDIQDYLDENFEGDVQAMKEYLARDANARRISQQYQLLYSALKDEEVPPLSFNLAEKVVTIIKKRKEQKEKFWSGVLTITLIALGAVAIIICLFYFDVTILASSFNTAFLSIAILLSIGFLSAFNFIDVEMRRRKFDM
jgi:hypothetical protein